MYMGRYIVDRSQYYYHYYQRQKDAIRCAHYEKKLRREEAEKIYEPYGGEKEYYKQAIMKWINEDKEKEKNKHIDKECLEEEPLN